MTNRGAAWIAWKNKHVLGRMHAMSKECTSRLVAELVRFLSDINGGHYTFEYVESHCLQYVYYIFRDEQFVGKAGCSLEENSFFITTEIEDHIIVGVDNEA